ncbi:MAG: hypothetical protein ACRDGM_18130 [bacterium]
MADNVAITPENALVATDEITINGTLVQAQAAVASSPPAFIIEPSGTVHQLTEEERWLMGLFDENDTSDLAILHGLKVL